MGVGEGPVANVEGIHDAAKRHEAQRPAIKPDGWARRSGIDRLLTLSRGPTHSVDEQIRIAEWPDVLLERRSNKRARSPGWVQKPLACNIIPYAQAAICGLLPVLSLQRAWRQCRRQWIGLYSQRRAEN